ncbi:Fe2+-dependent dioxygenase [Pelagibius litoralis]|uniref:Fe2+-dependent dioxygenase n=1 Tax=Pelagibius litoralis TaxID=374515 RepID=A0A967EZ64_9PROT|nr:Fe2+-dependent dioxygenase [Pelagibius litoralis]NIA70097.1 Fe2+-dependent dioxygenase [Pelagibius litoralis]
MILTIENLLSGDDLARLRGLLDEVDYVDGRKTAGWHAKLVKANEQSDGRNPKTAAARDLVTSILRANVTFNLTVMPQAIRPVLFSRYREGMSYGAHIDDAIMGREVLARSDVSMTIFLNAPEDYDGGELIMELGGGELRYKLPAGAAVFYPSNTLHRVAEVTRGQREVAVTWAQSIVRSAEHREILYDIDKVRRSLFREKGKDRDFDLLSKTHANLMRLWSDV